MLIPTKTLKQIYSKLFQDGTLVAFKDLNATSSWELKEVANIYVIKSMQSLKSRGFVKETFSFRHFYWTLTDEGITYLRSYLHLPNEVVPDTLKVRAPKEGAVRRPGAGRPAPSGDRQGDRDGYRRAGPSGEKRVGADAGFKPEFRGGFGRGRGAAGAPSEGAAVGRGRGGL